MTAKIAMLYDKTNVAIQERDRALAEKNAALDDRDLAIQQRDAAIADRDNALRERDNAIAALQFHESTMDSLFRDHPSKSARSLRENCITDAFPISIISPEATELGQAKSTKSPQKTKKVAQESGSINLIHFDESTMPVPVCSCTGVARQCYKWGNGGWQSACCTTSLSVYPLPQIPNKKHVRMGGRKMSGSVFSRLLTRMAAAGHDLSIAVDLKSYWAKHGTNRYITIK
ncbi:protein basic pentacysteine4 [Phtheirospermum japonicum]|uniref:GAGA-binding transcriptional activator n=1 Tax=Phtheirospermum japonicum TaxID=374723 RepID=A0A830C0L3_9LAMI|nr:protein basic pentacysteine4 [Phtheirospermum japonicum]